MLGWTLIIAGFIAVLPYLCTKYGFLGPIGNLIKQAKWFPTFQIILGLWCLFAGVYKLVMPDWPKTMFVGDLIPAAASLCIGLLLAMVFFKQQKNLPQDKIELLNQKLTAYQFPIGVIAIAAGIIHTFFWMTLGSQAFF